MARLRQIVCLLLVALWVPATLHCDFEALELAEIFDCASDHHEPAAADACADACDVVESGWIKRAPSEVVLASPTLQACLIFLAIHALAAHASDRSAPLSASTAAPPELAHTWQFLSRAAPPPRAPSLAG